MTDGQLIEQVRQGDIKALGVLYERYHTQVFRTALAITRDQQTAEDILQDVFLRLYRYAESIDASLPLPPWLYRVTVNLCYTLGSRQKRWGISLEQVVEGVGEWAKQVRRGPERQAEQSELQTVIQKAIDSLSENHKTVVILYYLSGLSVKEIAQVLQIPEGTVKSRLYYGRKTLRRKLEGSQALFPEVAYEFT